MRMNKNGLQSGFGKGKNSSPIAGGSMQRQKNLTFFIQNFNTDYQCVKSNIEKKVINIARLKCNKGRPNSVNGRDFTKQKRINHCIQQTASSGFAYDENFDFKF